MKEATDCITLHAAAPLQLKAAALIQAGLLTTTRRRAERIEVDEKHERVRLYFSGGQVKQGKFSLAVRWEGKFDRSMKGSVSSVSFARFELTSVTTQILPLCLSYTWR